jgi:hypothetical protein
MKDGEMLNAGRQAGRGAAAPHESGPGGFRRSTSRYAPTIAQARRICAIACSPQLFTSAVRVASASSAEAGVDALTGFNPVGTRSKTLV